MKTKIIVSLLTAALLQSGVAVLMAQDAPAPPAPQGQPPGGPGMRGPGMRGLLTPAEREKLRAAHEKAKSDPKVVAARDDVKTATKEMRDTERAAILKDDSSMQAVFDKIDSAKNEHQAKNASATSTAAADQPQNPPPGEQPPPPPDANAGDKPHDGPPGEFRRGPGPRLDMLTQEERDKLRAAHEKVKDQADVKAAREKVEAAMKNLRDAERAAMIKADPSVEPILKKLDEQRNKRGAMGRRMGPPGPPSGEEPPAPETTGT